MDNDLDNIKPTQAVALVDSDSMKVDWNWNHSRFTNRAEGARRVIQAMNFLQSTNTGATSMPVVDECMQFHIAYLPDETRQILHYELAFAHSNPSRLFDFDLTTIQFEQNNREFWRSYGIFFDNVRKATWTMIPLAVNGHFTTLILHAKRKEMPGTTRGFRTIIQNAVVAEPQRNAELEQFIWDRLQLILTEERGFTFKRSKPVKLWFPKQYDMNTCGFRVYEIMRIMMMRISQSVAEEGLKDGYNPDYIWQDMSGDFQPDKVRAEMIGILANVAMRYTNWSTRLFIVPVSHVKDRTMGALPNTWVATESYSGRLSDLPKRNPMQYSENIMVDRLLRLGVGPSPDLMQISPINSPDKIADDTPQPPQQNRPDWGVLPPRPEQQWRSPQKSPDSPPFPQTSQTATPTQPVRITGPGSGLPPALQTPGSGLPPALTPSNLPPALIPGPRPGSGPFYTGNILGTPFGPPLPPSTGSTPYQTPRRTSRAASDEDEPMSNT